MLKLKLLSVFFFCTTAIFAQDEQRNAEISELARKNAQSYCECPSLDLIISLSEDFKSKKINIDELKEGGNYVMVQALECIRPLIKEMRELTPEEFEFFSKEAQKYRLEFCAAAIAKKKNVN